MELKSYRVSIDGEHWYNINHTSAGKAKSEFYRTFDCDIKYTWLKCRVNGAIVSPFGFENTTKYRGVDFAYCGMVVEIDGNKGWIVGNNASANFNVLFFDGALEGKTLNCHPNWKIKYFDRRGKIIKEFQ